MLTKEHLTLTLQSIKKLLSNKADKSEIVQSNWSQSDKTASDYIKNRPFYEEEKYENIFTSGEHTVTGTYYDSSQFYHDFSGIKPIEFVKGETYRVSYCGVSVDIVANYMYELYWQDENNQPYGVGSSNSGSTGIMRWYGANSGITAIPFTTNLTIEKVEESVHQLDEKYIPDTIARVPSDEEAVELLIEMGIADPVTNTAGAIYTDNNNLVYTL